MTTSISGTSGVTFPDGGTHASGSGRLIAVRVFTTAHSGQTYTPTVGTRLVRVKLVGGGGAGGPTAATGSNTYAYAQGGNAGGYAESVLTADVAAGVTMTIGTGGIAPAGVAAGPTNAGGVTSFGGLLQATGGEGGLLCPATTVSNIMADVNSTPGVGSGGNVLNMDGGVGAFSIMLTGGALSGSGGNTPLGAGGGIVGAVSGWVKHGRPASGYGAGGGGGASRNAAAAAGGNGAPGVIIVEEYA